MTSILNRRQIARLMFFGGLLLMLVFASDITQPANAQGGTEQPTAQGSPMHPAITLLDADGLNVLSSSKPVSTMKTCGSCHDTAFIASHSFHVDVGLSGYGKSVNASHAWDTSAGLFGEWDPVTYRYLSAAGDTQFDLTTADWIKTIGTRHVGGGPATTARDGQTALTALKTDQITVETGTVDPATGQLKAWNWQESGVVEMNCFLCHSAKPNNQARIESLQAGQFAWANSATLLGTGLIEKSGDTWRWIKDKFDIELRAQPTVIGIQDPTSNNCGQCHGLVYTDTRSPLVTNLFDPAQYKTYTTGQVMSPQRISISALNLNDKNSINRSWDVHAARVVECTDCHYSVNNPVYYRESSDKPAYLVFDPRRIDFGEYLNRPSHQFAKGSNAASTPGLENTMRRCESCHDATAVHTWLPYKARHISEVACETCHIPKLYAPALKSIDWTALTAEGSPRQAYRGLSGQDTPSKDALITGYEPVLLPRKNADGKTAVAPFNLISAWYWVSGDPARPIPLRNLQAAWFTDGKYAAEVLAAFDADKDGQLSDKELLIDTPEKQSLIAGRLTPQGLINPRIVGEVNAYSISHNVTNGEWAIRDCRTCHSESSRLENAISLASSAPGGVIPTLSSTITTGSKVQQDKSGALFFQTPTEADHLYIFGNDNVPLIDLLGTLIFLGVMVGVVLHGGLRYFSARRRVPRDIETKQVYMYSLYERQWHWLQTLMIFGLIWTGMVIHKPNIFGAFSFPGMVEIHNILAVILVINAALAAFYHFASGEIRQFLPKPVGFFDQAFSQAKFYLRGIFKGDEHPFEKTRQQKMNPLQQITYLGLLNILLPAQIITGLMMMFVQQWPDVAIRAGGLPFLAPLHTAVAWLFSSFVVMHVYLTTTGHTPVSNVKAMITGWDEVEGHARPATGDK